MKKKHLLFYAICATCALVSVAAITFNIGYRGRPVVSYAALEEEVVTQRVMPEKPDAPEEEPPQEAEEENPYAWDGDGAELEIDFRTLKEKNLDTIGWLHLPAVEISYPVLYYEGDNDYYLNRSFDGAYSAAGVIYLEHTNRPDFSEMNSFLYGHNMADGTMFGRLHLLARDADKYDAYPYFYLYLPDGTIRRYLIFSFYPTSSGTGTYFVPETEEAYDTYVEMVRGNSVREIDADFTLRPDIVTLSTCHGGAGTTKRFVVHGILNGVFDPASTQSSL